MTKWICLAAALSLPLALRADDQPKKPAKKPVEAFTDAAKAGPDFAAQGEYTGEHGDHKLGVQFIALGDGQFRAKVLGGGLPGEGWDGETIMYAKASAGEGGKLTFVDEKNPDHKSEVTFADGKATVQAGDQTFTLTKVTRKSATEGAKPPEGAKVLFDGTNLEGWTKADGKTAASWKLLEGGVMQVSGGDILSKEKFAGPHTIHVEFRLPFMPRASGQGRANSGVYVQNRYELQVLDSFGLKGLNNEAGGFYQASDPKVNMCYPPLQWQTYDIEVTPAKFENGQKAANARCTVKHNGVVVQDNVELKGPTPGGVKESDAPDGIRLQDHGNPVQFRNIWVSEKK